MAPIQEKITLYWLEQSRSQRILWLLEELKLEYEVKTYRRVDRLAPPELKAVHPLGKSPLIGIERADRKPLILAESSFIAEYLLDHYENDLAPPKFEAGSAEKVGDETEAWLRYRHLLHFAEGSMMPYLVMKLVTERTVESAFVNPNIENNLSFLNGLLETCPDGGQYLCGAKLTAADILMSFPLIASKARIGIDATKYPKLVAYVDRIEKEPGYVASIKKIEAIDGQKFSATQ